MAQGTFTRGSLMGDGPVGQSLERVAGLVVLPAAEIGARLDRGTTLLD